LNIMTPCVTFDQPLWIKATDIVKANNMDIVCRLEPFHTLMSFFRKYWGSVMAGSGLAELLETCYGPNAVTHIMTGKAVARSLRAHFMVQSALTCVIMKSAMLCCDSSQSRDNLSTVKLSAIDHANLQKVYDQLVHHEITDLNELEACESLNVLRQVMKKAKVQASEESRTATLWIQYINYIDIVKAFIRAERTGDWEMHLTCVAKMLNLCCSTGHHNYAKSARLHLDLMIDLP